MSTVKTVKYQVGTDGTSTNNFTIYQPDPPDGTMRIGVGNADSPTEIAQFTSSGLNASALTGTLPAIDASSLTNIPAANLTGTLPALDGSSLTGIASIGVGQTWQNLTSSRALGTTYTNSTGSPIMFAVTVNTTATTNSKASISVDGLVVARTYPYASGVYTPMFAIVPNGSTYGASNVSNTTLNRWTELR